MTAESQSVANVRISLPPRLFLYRERVASLVQEEPGVLLRQLAGGRLGRDDAAQLVTYPCSSPIYVPLPVAVQTK
jgi:hypothetical protein